MTEDLSPPTGGTDERRVGRYVLGARLGEGGMGVVWRSTFHDGRDVSIKVLRPHIAHDENARARLRREVDTLARVHHPRVASVLDADVDGPTPYIVTEFVPGAPLDAVVAEQGPLGPDALVGLGQGLSEALSAIHAVGIVHRDLKPGNVLMVGDDPVVIDFGIAQVADDSRLTMTGMVMGTPGYLSPEVVEGGSVTRATDWWGWAATLSFAASGKPPFGTGPMSVVLDRVVRGRTKLDGVDEQLRPLLLAALDPDPTNRPQAYEVMTAMTAYAAHRPVTEAMSAQSLNAVKSVNWTSGGSDQRRSGATAVHPTASGAGSQAAASARPAAAPQSTQMAPVVEPTRAQPVMNTQVAPQQPDVSPASGPPAYRSPHPYPYTESYPSQRFTGAGPQPQPGAQTNYPRPPGQAAPPNPWPQAGQPQPYGPPQGQYPGGATAYPAPQGDPRIGRPMRTGSVLTLWAVFVALSTVAPLLSWALLAMWSVLTRWIDRSMTGLVMRRHEAGVRGSDIPMLVLAAPWRLIPATLTTLLWLILPVGFGIVTALAIAFGIDEGSGIPTTIEEPLPIGVGSALGGLVGWWGPGAVSMRRGSRTLIRAAMPSGLFAQLCVTFLLVGSIALGSWCVLGAEPVSWWPNPTGDIPLIERLPTGIVTEGFPIK